MGLRRLILDLPLTVLTAAAILPAVGATRDPLRLPLTILRNNPVTSIEVAGHEIKIGVDTGGGVLGLTREALTQAGAVELAVEPTIWTDANGQEHKARRFRVPQIRVGGRLFTNLDAIEAEAVPNGPAVASVLGRDFLRQFVVIIDYPGRKMVLLDPAVPDVEAESMGRKGTRVPFEKSSEADLVVTRVEMDGATVRLGWDTGATYSALRAGVVTAHQLPVTPPGRPKAAVLQHEAPDHRRVGFRSAPVRGAVLGDTERPRWHARLQRFRQARRVPALRTERATGSLNAAGPTVLQ